MLPSEVLSSFTMAFWGVYILLNMACNRVGVSVGGCGRKKEVAMRRAGQSRETSTRDCGPLGRLALRKFPDRDRERASEQFPQQQREKPQMPEQQ